MTKKPISSKVTEGLKNKLDEEAEAKEITISELIAEKLGDYDVLKEKHLNELTELKTQLTEKDELIMKLSDNLSTEQKLLHQQQELQLRSQRQFEELQRSHNLIEMKIEESKKGKWWNRWRSS